MMLMTLLFAAAIQTPRELAAENEALVAKYSPSVAVVKYYVKKNEKGLEPKFEIPYRCPNCENTHWRDAGVSVEDRIPAVFAGYVIAPDEVMLQDVRIDPAFIDHITVTAAGETRTARESAVCTREGALVLKTTEPFTAAKPLVFTGGGEPQAPRYFYLTEEDGITIAGVKPTRMPEFRHFVEIGKSLYEGHPNTIVLDEQGEPVTLAYQNQIILGSENFTAPSTWVREPADVRFVRRTVFESSVAEAVLPVYIQLEAPSKDEGRGSRNRFFSSDDDANGNDIDTTLILIEDLALVRAKLTAEETARIAKMEAILPDGSKVPLTFVGSFAEYGALAVTFEAGVPAGLKPLTIDRRAALAHFGETLRVASVRNVGGAIEVAGGEIEILAFGRGRSGETIVKGDRVIGAGMSEDDNDRFKEDGLMISDQGLVALMLKERKETRSYRSSGSLQPKDLVALVEKPVFDAENVPRSAEDRRRTPYLGVEVQEATAEILREKKATAYLERYSSASLVSFVAPDSPAQTLGIKEGDILLTIRQPGGRAQDLRVRPDYYAAINWAEVFDDERFLEAGNTGELMPWPNVEGGVNALLAEKFGVGMKVIVAWVSDGQRKEGECTLALAPVHFQNAPKARNKDLAVTVCDLTDEVRKYFKLAADAPGVVVRKVKSGGVAAVAGLKPLELVLEVNGVGVTSAKDFAEKTKGQKNLTLTVRRLTTTRVVPIAL